ncbi:MAG: Gfo/Idh/MocA family oxidoreductase [Candidatus Hydrogenedentota bacterium]
MNRRTFLATGAAALAGAARGQVEGAKVLAPGERVRLAVIGVGGQGKDDLKRAAYYGHEIVALCDADLRIADAAFRQFPDAKQYQDYRVMLDEMGDKIDGVIIATPDHHHFPASMAALRHGKHVYCEKPLTHSIWEARELAAEAKTSGVATQMGNTGQASNSWREISEYIRAGAIGEVREVHVWTNRPIWPQGIDRPAGDEKPHDELNWDLWLGPAPERPFNDAYHPFRWRGWMDFGTGAIGDMACHELHPVFKVLDLGFPESAEATSTAVNKETFPHASTVRYEFPSRGAWPALTLYWYDGGMKPFRPRFIEDTVELESEGTLYVGSEGAILEGKLLPEAKFASYPKPPETLPRSIGHWEEWFAAIKGEKVAPGSNFGFAGFLTESVLLGNVAIRAGRKLHWDGAAMRVTNYDEANALLKREYRAGWVS